jgi:hypothetical protein
MMCYDMFYVEFHARCISMHMSLNGTEHMYTVTIGLNMMIYMVSCLDGSVWLYSSNLESACI